VTVVETAAEMTVTMLDSIEETIHEDDVLVHNVPPRARVVKRAYNLTAVHSTRWTAASRGADRARAHEREELT
jgi:hypothetical protein